MYSSLFLAFILTLVFCYVFFASYPVLGMPLHRKESKGARKKQQKRLLHELPYTVNAESGGVFSDEPNIFSHSENVF